MHYDSRAYSTNGLDTIRPLHNASTVAPAVPQMGQRLYLTELDYANINFMYMCQMPQHRRCAKCHSTAGVGDCSTHLVSTSVPLISNTATFTSSPPSSVYPLGTQGLVLISSTPTPQVQPPPQSGAVPLAPVYTPRPLNSHCICYRNIWCIYKVLLYLFFVFLD